jgi:hypothetical protein
LFTIPYLSMQLLRNVFTLYAEDVRRCEVVYCELEGGLALVYIMPSFFTLLVARVE